MRRRVASLWSLALSGSLASAPALAAGPIPPHRADRGCGGPDAPITTVVDSTHDTVIITLGPCRVPALGAMLMDNMPGMAMMSPGPGHEDVRVHFRWPADVWMRSFDLTLLDREQHRLNQPTTMHHMELLNFDRRQLIYPMVERVFGMGEETSGAGVPKTVGLPLDAGADMGLYVMWNNHTDHDLEDVTFRLAIRYSPRNLSPHPTIVLPFKADVNIHPGAGDAFDLPPGGGSRSAVFTVGTSGHLLAAGGHLHDFGKELRLEDARTGKVLARVRAERTPDGKVTGVSHSLYGIGGKGPHLIAGRPYRLVAVYEGSPADSIRGAMGLMGGIFAPDHYHRWPRIDPRDPAYLIDARPSKAVVTATH
ncbi:MAG: hypothetical protein ABI703_03610 [Gemmatimonadales bacterium]